MLSQFQTILQDFNLPDRCQPGALLFQMFCSKLSAFGWLQNFCLGCIQVNILDLDLRIHTENSQPEVMPFKAEFGIAVRHTTGGLDLMYCVKYLITTEYHPIRIHQQTT